MKLANFLTKLNDYTVTIELKNGSSVKGTLITADPMMNCHMSDVTLKTKKLRDGDSLKLKKFTVRANTIRYVILPQDINLSQKIDEAENESQMRKHTMQNKPAVEATRETKARTRGSHRGGARVPKGRGRGRGTSKF